MSRAPILPPSRLLRLAVLVLASASLPMPGAASPHTPQDAPVPDGGTHPPDTAWNSDRVKELVSAAVAARKHAYSDSTLRSFRARAQGHVYFRGDIAGEAGEDAQIVRADQVALRIRWARDRSVQTLVGRRSEERLPSRIRYHIDHLSVVLDNFGDRISLGEGTEVEGVVHPLAPEGPDHYEYRLVDSLGLRIDGRPRTLYRVEVRPRDPDEAGVVGEMHLDSESGALARMRVTFTPAAYLDPELEGIEVDLQSALWDGRWWLPAEQSVTVRRRLRWLDLPLRGVIRTRIRVFDYEINPELRGLPAGHRVVSAPEPRLREFDGWRSGLYDGPVAPGAAHGDPADLRRRARELARDRYLRGDARLAPHLTAASDVLRARRAEGAAAGMGLRYALDDTRTVTAWAGHPFAPGGMEWKAGYRGRLGPLRLEVEAYEDRLTDVGPHPAASGVTSSFGFLLRGEDFTDPHFRDGASLTFRAPVAGGTARAGLRFERHHNARFTADPPGDQGARPIRPVREGDAGVLTLGWRPAPLGPLGGSLTLDLEAEGAVDGVGDFGYTRLLVRVEGRSGPAADPWGWRLRGGLGVAGGDLPPQRLLLLGGRGTVPGYPFRGWGGDRAAHVLVEASRQLLGPWMQLRGIAAAGWAEVGGPGTGAVAAWGPTRPLAVDESGGVRPSLGLGLGFVDGILRVDAVRGLDDGRWEWMVSVDPRWWEVL